MKNGIIFDLDGTLWDSSKTVTDGWNKGLAEYDGLDVRVSEDDVRGFMGMLLKDIFSQMLKGYDEDFTVKVMNTCCRYEEEYINRYGGELVDKLEMVLCELKEKYNLYIVSNCQCGYIEGFFMAHGLQNFFEDTECAGGTGLDKGDNITLVVNRNKLDKALYVGDTMSDYKASCKAGVTFAHAAYGFGEVPEAEFRLNNISELVDIAKKVFEE